MESPGATGAVSCGLDVEPGNDRRAAGKRGGGVKWRLIAVGIVAAALAVVAWGAVSAGRAAIEERREAEPEFFEIGGIS